MGIWQIDHRDPDVVELGNSDPKMERLIQYIGDIEVEMRTDYFLSITRSIIGQLISSKAADTIFTRLEALLHGDISALSISNLTEEELRAVGMPKKESRLHPFPGARSLHRFPRLVTFARFVK
ncbi:hypothetical protein RWE15_19875 [Virgibacillus halophilus]|uniref:Uncharacterized protein n=1 Tax=Tigheibacillus halophilus TaxID=361280 RepID=A0ABU5CAF7_9BACI|nr:hypothetical protein [Virgibacillus halophilus]